MDRRVSDRPLIEANQSPDLVLPLYLTVKIFVYDRRHATDGSAIITGYPSNHVLSDNPGISQDHVVNNAGLTDRAE